MEIPGGELAVLPELIRGHPSPARLRPVRTALRHGRPGRDRHRRRRAARRRASSACPPAASTPTATRWPAARCWRRRAGTRRPPGAARGALGGRRAAGADRHLRARGPRRSCARTSPSTAWPTSPAAACATCCAWAASAWASPSSSRCPCRAICTLVAQHGDVPTAEMWDVFNMGCGFVALVPEERAADAVALLGAQPPGDGADRHGDRRGRAAVRAGAVAAQGLRAALAAPRGAYCLIEGRSQRRPGRGRLLWRVGAEGNVGECWPRQTPATAPDPHGRRHTRSLDDAVGRRAAPPTPGGRPPQKISGHHGATSQRNAAEARASAPGRSSATRPAPASSRSVVPPR